MPDGTPITIYTLRNGNIEARICNYGGIVTTLKVPDRNGQMGDVVTWYDNLTTIEGEPLFRLPRGPLRQPHREGQVRAERGLHPRHKQRPERPARRRQGLRQGRLAGAEPA